MKRGQLWGLTGAVVVLALVSAGNGQDPLRDPLKEFMRAKLTHSQRVLEGLVEEDFPKIDKHAQEMNLLSLAETWQVLHTAEYSEFSRKFRRAVDTLSDMAKKRNLEQSTVAFNEVTTQCVECHKYVRKVQMAGATSSK
jgi:cytochrome c556